MPGRIAATAPRTRTTRKAATVDTTIIPDEGEDTSLRKNVCAIFADSQKSNAGHRKCVIALRKLQEKCCYAPVSVKGRKEGDFEEADFNREFSRCSLRVLAIKKSEPVADRVVRFVGTFLNAASIKDNELVNQNDDPDVTTLPETPTSRLTSHLIGILVPLLQSRDKTVRFRATQLTSHIVNSLDSLDDELFHSLRSNLMKRIHDKEAPVRLQAVYGLGRLAAEVDEEQDEDSDTDRESGAGVLEKLLTILQHDPSAEVRRNLLLNLPLNKDVLPYLLERARDSDNSTRRALYAKLLPALGDFRHLSLTHREKLLRWGLRDRDETVRLATARLFRARWIEDCAAVPTGQEAENEEGKQQEKTATPSLDALLELLERIDIINSGADGGIAQIAMKEFWQGRPDYISYISFPESYWEELTPELAFVARTFNDHCRSPQSKSSGNKALDALAEEKLPEVSTFGNLLDRELKALIDSIVEAAAGEEDDEADERAAQHEFIVEQMLQMALTFDYSDEVGRRKMFGLMRETLALPELPEEITKLVVETLRLVCGPDARGEKEFCGVVLEAVAEVHDTIMTDETELDTTDMSSIDESFHSATSHQSQNISKKGSKKAAEEKVAMDKEKIIKEIMVNMKCLHIAQCMLQNVACELEENVHLVTMLNNLIVPAVRSQEAPIRERGLVCLGLCCLLGKNLAQENLTLFQHCFNKGHPALQTIALQVIGDILVTHPSLIAVSPQRHQTEDDSIVDENAELLRQVLKMFSKAIKSGEAGVQATGVTALAKMMLSRLISDADLLKQMVVAYFDPETSSNAQLRQSLTYFLPVYCHSRVDNAARMVSILCPVLAKLSSMHEAFLDDVGDVDDADSEMVTLTTVANMLIDWTDPRKLQVSIDGSRMEFHASETHFLLAEAVLERLVTSQVSKDERKVLLASLGKLHLPADGCSSDRIKTVLDLLTEAIDTKVATDATGRNALTKMQTQLQRMIRETTPHGTDAVESIETEQLSDQTSRMTLSDERQEEMSNTAREANDLTIGIPDAEGTRVVFNEESELLASDDDDDDTTVS